MTSFEYLSILPAVILGLAALAHMGRGVPVLSN
jgi:hypothetical protein